MKLGKKTITELVNVYNQLSYDELIKFDNALLERLGVNYKNKVTTKNFLKLIKSFIKNNINKYEKNKIEYQGLIYSLPDFYNINSINENVKEKFIFCYLYTKNENFKEKFNKEFLYNYKRHYFLKSCSFVLIFLLFLFITGFTSLKLICYGPSKKARNMFVSTFLETGALKFIPSLIMSDEEISSIVSTNTLEEFEENVDSNQIEIDLNQEKDIEIEKVYGENYFGTMMIVHDPSKVSLATTYPFTKYGKELDVLVNENNAIAGVNGGLYESLGNKGGYPVGVVVSNGEIVYNKPYGKGYHLIGLDKNNVLKILSMVGLDEEGVKELVSKEEIRDAVTFQEEYSDANNHFVKLIINGENRKTNGLGSGANPRTAIGQRADGAILFFVTDGRGTSGHLGATANDLIEVMSKYGAVNAANIDGGSSSSMYYDGNYLMTSVTLYVNNKSWRLPDAFIIKK